MPKLLLLAVFLTALQAHAQAPGPTFEVATVRPVLRDATHRFDPHHFYAHVNKSHASYWSMTPDNLITYAYGIENYQVAAPEWMDHDFFDIEARIPEGANPKDQRKMLQALLKDRFKIAFHIEQRELTAYVLTIGKHGDRLKPSLPDPPAPEVVVPPADGAPTSRVTKNSDGSSTVSLGKSGTQTIRFDAENSAMHMERSKMSLEELAGALGHCLGDDGHRIIDETGLKGDFQIVYDCPFAKAQSSGSDVAGVPSDPQGSSVLTRSLDAMGLKLEKRKMVLPVYVIDHAEQPTEN